jgi:hypothetical protein
MMLPGRSFDVVMTQEREKRRGWKHFYIDNI